MSDKTNLDEINKIPSPTWSWLKMNADSMTIDENPSVLEMNVRSSGSGFSIAQNGASIEVSGKPDKPLLILFDCSKKTGSLASSQTIRARKDSEAVVIFLYEGDSSQNVSVIRTNVHAEENSKIHIIKAQLLGKNQNQIDETSCLAEKDSLVRFTQIELGGNHVCSALHAMLDGHKARFQSETAFIAKGSQHLDMNHVVIHKADKTDTKMSVKGVVDGNAVKTYRGTIDFRRGCAGATGDEQEETLLMSGSAVNKSIPVILCDEEDVSGSHGATLGRLGADELFYMQSRGVSEDEAKKMMTRAKVLSASALIPDLSVRKKIEDFIGA